MGTGEKYTFGVALSSRRCYTIGVMTETKTDRDDHGKYTHALERMCKCGHAKGEHDAVLPYPLEDADCPRFRLDRKAGR